MDKVKPEWKLANRKSALENSDTVFKQYPDDETYLCLKRKNVLGAFTELNDCSYAWKGLLDLVESSDVEYKEKQKKGAK